MAKDPAFLFYSSDFLTGTTLLTDEQTGKYIRLLCLQHQIGHLSEKDMLKICKTYDDDIFCKFERDPNGNFFNVRLENEANKRKAYSESRKANREKKNESHDNHMSNISKTYVPHMENENENINEDIIELKLKGAFDEIYMDQLKPKWSHIDFDFEYKTFCDKVRDAPEHYHNHDRGGMRMALLSQLRGARKKGKPKPATVVKFTMEDLNQKTG